MAKLKPDAWTEEYGHYENLQVAADDPDKVHFILQADRLGSKMFCVKLEYEHYPPRSGRNKFLDFHIIQWPYDDNGRPILLWFVIGIPKKDLHIAEQVANETGMALEQGAIPVMIFQKGGSAVEERFPMEGNNCYTVKSKPSSIIYNNDQEMMQRQRAAEEAECERIIQADEQKMKEDFLARGYTPEQIRRIVHKWNTDDPNYIEPPEGGVPDGQNRMKDKD